MAVLMVVFAWAGAFFTLSAICEKVVPDKVWDKIAHILKFD